MKVLQINAVNAIKSTGRTCLEMSNFLNEKGHICVTAYAMGPSVNAQDEIIIGSYFDRKIHAFFSRFFGIQGYFSRLATKKFLAKVKKFSPEIVVLNNLHGNYINLSLLLGYLAKKNIATVVVLHDCWFYTGKCCHYTAKSCYKWKESCGACPQLKKYNKSWFFDRTEKMLADKKKLFSAIPRLAVVGVSDWITEEAKKAPVFSNAKIFKRIYNWIDTETFAPRNTNALREKLGLEGKKVILAVASKWSKEKGINTLLEVARKLSDNEKLLLVGNIGEITLPDSVIHIPATNSVSELAEYYSIADVFFQPSLEETFGKVTAEALSSGAPVVCFNSTANPELVGEGCGAVVPVGDIDGLYKEIKEILSKEKSVYSKACREFAEQNFDMEKNLSEYAKLFEEINS